MTQKRHVTPLAIALLLLALPGPAFADTPSLSFGYTGVLLGEPDWWTQSLPVDLEIRLCTSGTDGAGDCAWQQSFAAWSMEGGHFSVELGGAAAPLAASDLDGPRWLEVKYRASGEPPGAWLTVTPRVKVAAVPLALVATEAARATAADDADRLGGLAPEAYAAHDHTHSEHATADALTTGLGGKADVDHDHAGVYASSTHTHALVDLESAGCTEGQVLKWLSGAWTCGSDLQGGSGGQEYEAGAGLTLTGATFSLDAAKAATVLGGWDQSAADDLTTATAFGGDVSGTYDALVLSESAVDALVGNNGYAAAGHGHGWEEITGKPTEFAPAAHTQGWETITGKPETFAPEAHAHAWDEVTGKPATFPAEAHGHDDLYYPRAEVDTALAGKAASGHGHGWDDLSNVPADLADGDDDTTYSGTDFAVSLQGCPEGQFAVGVDASGLLECETTAGGLPSDGLGTVSNGTLTNLLTGTYTASGQPAGIGSSVDVAVEVPDAGSLRELSVTVSLSHPYCPEVEVRLVPPGEATNLRLIAAGDATGTNCTYSQVFGWDEALPDGGRLSDWEGREIAGTWTLRVTDTLVNGNEGTGQVTGFGLTLGWLSSEATWAGGDLQVNGALRVCDVDLCGRLAALDGDVATHGGELSAQAGVNDTQDGEIDALEQGHTNQAALIAALQAKLWCLENCDPDKLKDCREWSCDGSAEICTDAGAQVDGSFCLSGGKAGTCVSGACCVPSTCAELGAQCGQAADGCGGVVACGACQQADAVCVANQCCVPSSCASLGKDCGDWDDGCGGTTGECGPCGSDYSCDADGHCVWDGTCDGVVCPELSGYTASCNGAANCEYANADPSGWKAYDVWIYVPPGSFSMGSPSEESSNGDEKPVHTVTFTEGYFIGKFEIPVVAYEACEAASSCTAPSTADWDGEGWGTNRSTNGRSEHPQNGLQWQQAKDFCAWVAPGGRLPGESEWEYAASGPVHRKYPWGDSPDPTCANGTANFNEAGGTGGYGCSTGGTMPVGSKTAGASVVGALDMSGNVWEWCEDWYHSDYTDAPSDGSAWIDPSGSDRVIRGGSFSDDAVNMRSAERYGSTPAYRYADIGARCLRPLP